MAVSGTMLNTTNQTKRAGRRALLGAALGLMTLAGCVTEGHDFRADTTWIKPNKTNMQDVQMLLKEPYSVGNAAGQKTWTYGYYKYQLIGASHQKELKFYWNPDGTVNNFSFTSNFMEDTGKETGPGKAAAAAAASDY